MTAKAIILAKKFGIGQWSFIGSSSEKKWYSGKRIVHKELGSYCGRNAVGIHRKVDILFSVQRLHCPGKSSKAKDTENCPYILLKIKESI